MVWWPDHSVNDALDTQATKLLRRARDLQLAGQPRETVRVMRRLARDSGNRADILLATVQREFEAGDRNALTTFRRALYLRGILNQNKLGDADLAQLQRLAASTSTPATDRAFIDFAISGAMERRGGFAQAFDYCTAAHDIKSALKKNSGDHYNRDAHKH